MHTTAHDLVLVSDDALLARSVQTSAQGRCNVIIARSVAEARTLLETQAPRAVIVDGVLVAKQAAKEVAKLRAVAPLAAMLFVAQQFEPKLVNELHLHRVQLLVRPLPSDALSLFITRAISAGRLMRGSLHEWVAQLSAERRLTRADVALLPYVLGEEDANAICARLGFDRAQLTRGLRRLVKKCRVRNTDRLARNLMRDSYLFGSTFTKQLIEHELAASF